MMLTYGEDAKKSQLTGKMFYKDDISCMHSTIITPSMDGSAQPNKGLQVCRQCTA